MDPKRLFFTLVFGLLGGYLLWTGVRALGRSRFADAPSDLRARERRRAVVTIVVGCVVWLALFLMYGPGSTAP